MSLSRTRGRLYFFIHFYQKEGEDCEYAGSNEAAAGYGKPVSQPDGTDGADHRGTDTGGMKVIL